MIRDDQIKDRVRGWLRSFAQLQSEIDISGCVQADGDYFFPEIGSDFRGATKVITILRAFRELATASNEERLHAVPAVLFTLSSSTVAPLPVQSQLILTEVIDPRHPPGLYLVSKRRELFFSWEPSFNAAMKLDLGGQIPDGLLCRFVASPVDPAPGVVAEEWSQHLEIWDLGDDNVRIANAVRCMGGSVRI
jgi:hypothetical protein